MPTNTQIKTNITTVWNVNGVSYSTIPLLSGINHKDQLEIERPFTTPSGVVLKQEDLRTVYVIPSSNYTIDETTKTILSITAPTTYTQTSTNTVIQIPAIAPNDKLIIRRKSISSESLVSWVDGTRLTATQLNLQTSQLLNLTQEILDRLKYEYVTSTDIDYNATYNTATKTWVQEQIGAISTSTVKGYVDLIGLKVGSGSIQAPNNTDIITKLNAIDTTVTQALSGTGSIFSGFPLGAVVITGTNGAKDYSSNFILTKGTPDLLTLTGNLTVNGGTINLIGETSVRGSSTNNILSIKNSSGVEVNTIDQYGNISRPSAPTTQPGNPIIGSLMFDVAINPQTGNPANNLLVYTSNGWAGLGAFQQVSGVDLTTAQTITGSKSFTTNTGFGISSNPLTIVDIKGPSSITSFTGSSVLGTTIRGSIANNDYSGIDFTGGVTGTGPKARIAALFGSTGSKLQLGTGTATSDTYTGITNTGITIDSAGKVGISNTTSPNFNLDVTGTGRFTSTLNIEGNTTLNNNVNIRFLDNTGTARNSFILDSSNIYKIGDISNAITDSDLELYAKRNFEFIANNTEIARFTTNGRFGLGTNNPSTSIHVVTNATANTITQGDGTGTLSIGINGTGAGSIIHTTSGVTNQLTLQATNGIFVNSNLQLNTSNKVLTNTIESSSSNLQLQNSTLTNRVGIGTASPTEKLEVDGNIKISSSDPLVTPKLISPVVETGIIQSTGTIEFRQGYNAAGGTTPDMGIDSTGTVIFATTPKVGANALLVPESPVIAGAHGSANTFRFSYNATYKHFDETNSPVSYLKLGRVVYVYGILGTSETSTSTAITIPCGTEVNANNLTYGLLRGLPACIGKKQHFLCQGWLCKNTDNVSSRPYVRERMILSGFVTYDGFLRIGGTFHEGVPLRSGTNLWDPSSLVQSGTSPNEKYTLPDTAPSKLHQQSTHALGALHSSGVYDVINSNNPGSTLDNLKFGYGTTPSTNVAWGPNTQYIIFNFSYIAAS
jgi:hypothetical protein